PDRHQQVPDHVGRRLGGEPRAEDARDHPPALQVALEPARPLSHPTPDRRDRLLTDRRGRAVMILPAADQQPDAQLEVLGETVGPGIAAERLKRLQADELPVPSEPDAADTLPGALVDLGEDRELDVLETREQAGISVA